MSSTTLHAAHGLRIAVEGCGHGTLHSIYASVKKSCELKGWDGVDLLIIGGDFQAVRNACDLKAVAMPEKYYAMHDFHEYYSGTRTAPYLTIFIGGNHEASNYMWELYYGGWAAPRIYYMGAANVVRLGPLRIAGLSGIWKGYNYNKPHFERLPYNSSDVRSIYHVRELDTRKLLQIRSQVDVGLSHDWPRGMEWKGNSSQLFRFKPYFEQEAKDGTLGSVAATKVLERLRPRYWFSAHMHAKYSAIWRHSEEGNAEQDNSEELAKNTDELDLSLNVDCAKPIAKNEAEIDLDLDDDVDNTPILPPSDPTPSEHTNGLNETGGAIPQEVRDLLPDTFAQPTRRSRPSLPFPKEIANKTTHFLALDKCLPNRHFLQLIDIEPHLHANVTRPLQLEYDKEWLAITRVFARDLQLSNPHVRVPEDQGDTVYRPLIEEEMQWVEENVVKPGKMLIPEDFEQTAPVYDESKGIRVDALPEEYTNPHTQRFCELLQLPNAFHASAEERLGRAAQGPRPEEGGGRGGHRNDNRGRGRGQGYGHGHFRGRGRGGGYRGARGHRGGARGRAERAR